MQNAFSNQIEPRIILMKSLILTLLLSMIITSCGDNANVAVPGDNTYKKTPEQTGNKAPNEILLDENVLAENGFVGNLLGKDPDNKSSELILELIEDETGTFYIDNNQLLSNSPEALLNQNACSWLVAIKVTDPGKLSYEDSFHIYNPNGDCSEEDHIEAEAQSCCASACVSKKCQKAMKRAEKLYKKSAKKFEAGKCKKASKLQAKAQKKLSKKCNTCSK